jgi:hypothetical protein
MIALCGPHHTAADHGVYSRDELKKLKRSLTNTQPTIAELPWSKREFLIRLGGCYSGGMDVAVALSGQRAIWLRRSDDGLLLLTGGTRLKFWLSRRNIGLELSFRRVTVAELSAILGTDRVRAEQEFERRVPVEVLDMFRWAKSRSANDWVHGSPPFQAPPEGIREAYRSGDPAGTFVKRWASSRCLDDEQKIPLLNFENLILYSGGRRIVIRNGIAADGYSIGYSSSFDNEAGGFNL